METIIETHGLTKRFGGLVAVNDVDFTVRRGEVRGLIGPNGSGKTTLINLLTGVYEPTEGQVLFRGQDVTGRTPNEIARHGLLRTFQVPRLFGSMTVLENMLVPRFADFSLSYRKAYPQAVARAQELLEMAGIVHLRDEPARTLSGGQKSLLQMVRAFMVEDIAAFLLDEPFAGVNIVVKDIIMDLINEMAQEGVTFVLVSHEMASVRTMCPRVTVLAEGTIVAEGPMEEVATAEHVIEAYLGG